MLPFSIDSVSLLEWYASAKRPITFLVQVKRTGYAHPWYLKSVRNGEYTFVSDPLSARPFSRRTAEMHRSAIKQHS